MVYKKQRNIVTPRPTNRRIYLSFLDTTSAQTMRRPSPTRSYNAARMPAWFSRHYAF
jgi:hypothetical protein